MRHAPRSSRPRRGPEIEPPVCSETTRQQWQDAAAAWDRWGAVIERWLGPATEVMLDMAGVREGSRVLDVAAGAGASRRRCERVAGVEARRHSRGHRVLHSAGERVLLRSRLDHPPPGNLPAPAPGQPGPFSLGEPGVIESAYERAGFSDVATRRMAASLRLKSASECVRFEQESFGALHQMLAGLSEDGRAEAWAEIEQALGRFEERVGSRRPASCSSRRGRAEPGLGAGSSG